MLLIVAAVLAAATATPSAQQPQERPGLSDDAGREQAQHHAEQDRARPIGTSTPRAFPIETDQAHRAEPAQKGGQDQTESPLKVDWWTFGLGVINAIVAAAVCYFTSRLTRLTERQKEIADAALRVSDESLRVSATALHTSRAIERAYVALSHHPPGMIVPRSPTSLGDDRGRYFGVRVRVMNHGNTPARITAVSAAIFYGELPATPSYDEPDKIGAFLMKGESYTVDRTTWIPDDRMNDIKVGALAVWVVGYVDYLDQFGQGHRGGYARVYIPDEDEHRHYSRDRVPFDEEAYAMRNNLHFVREGSGSVSIR